MAKAGATLPDKAAIYYAIAILRFLVHEKHSCLIQDVVQYFRHRGVATFRTPTATLMDESLIEVALDKLQAARLVRVEEDDFAPPLIIRTSDATNLSNESIAGRFGKKDETVVLRYYSAGVSAESWLLEALAKINMTVQSLPASLPSEGHPTAEDDLTDSDWEPLPLDRTKPEAIEALTKTDEALKVIEQNNGYAVSEPDERNAIVESIRGTLNAVRTGFPSLAAIKSGLLAPLKYIVKKFGDSAMGEAAKLAVAALIKWLF